MPTRESVWRASSDGACERRCSRCKAWKPATARYWRTDSTKRGGLQSNCKACHTGRPDRLDLPVVAALCLDGAAHHYVLSDPAELVQVGTCKRCGVERQWQLLDDADYAWQITNNALFPPRRLRDLEPIAEVNTW